MKKKNEGFFKNSPNEDIVLAKKPKLLDSNSKLVSPSMNEFLKNEGDIEIKVARVPTNMDEIRLRQQLAQEKLIEQSEEEEKKQIFTTKIPSVKSPRSEFKSPPRVVVMNKPNVAQKLKIQ
jgi:hypothetical protein